MQEGSKNEINSNFPKLEADKLCLPSAILLFVEGNVQKVRKVFMLFCTKSTLKAFLCGFLLG